MSPDKSSRVPFAGDDGAGRPVGGEGAATAHARHLPYLLAAALIRTRRELESAIPPGLRVSHMRVLEELDRGRADRPTVFAPILGMTKAGAGKICDQLEEAGLIESVPDPADARVRRLRLTAAGRAVRATSDRAIAELEHRFSTEVGPDAYTGLRSALARLIETPG